MSEKSQWEQVEERRRKLIEQGRGEMQGDKFVVFKEGEEKKNVRRNSKSSKKSS